MEESRSRSLLGVEPLSGGWIQVRESGRDVPVDVCPQGACELATYLEMVAEPKTREVMGRVYAKSGKRHGFGMWVTKVCLGTDETEEWANRVMAAVEESWQMG